MLTPVDLPMLHQSCYIPGMESDWSGYMFVLDVFLNTKCFACWQFLYCDGNLGYELYTPVKRELKLRNCLHQIGLWAGLGHFLDCWLLQGPALCGWCLPWQVGRAVASLSDEDVTWDLEDENPFPPRDALGHGVSHGHRKAVLLRSSGKLMDSFLLLCPALALVSESGLGWFPFRFVARLRTSQCVALPHP